jgi:hypothetical protein
MQARRFPDAARVLEGILELDPDNAEAMVHLGTLAYWEWSGMPEENRSEALLKKAESLLKAAIAAAPEGSLFLADAHRNLGAVIKASRKP